MATLKYKQLSPYSVVINKAPSPPKEDLKYCVFESNFKADNLETKQCFGFALFGVGRAGTTHLSFLIKEPQIDLLYIIDDDRTKWERIRNHWNLKSVKFLTSSEAEVVYKDENVRAIVVASPTFTHETIVSKALDYKKAVFCEKPIAETYETSKALYEKAKSVNQPLLSAFNRRFDPSYESLKTRVHNGEVGRVLTIKVCSRDSPLPSLDYLKISGGIFHDCAVHDIDQTVSILGEYPIQVSAFAAANIPEIAAINDFDTVAILMRYKSGTVAVIDLSRQCSYGYDQRVEVFGEKGMIRAENQRPMHNLQAYGESAVKYSPIYYSFASRYQEGYEREMKHFVQVLEGKAELSVDSEDVLAVTRIASACEESARSGKIVQLDWN